MLVQVHSYHSSTKKRIFDIISASIMLMVSLPVLFIISIVVFLSSGKPILFLQKRSGLYKKPFTLYKFRTMKVRASIKQSRLMQFNQAPAPMFKIHNDPRFTGVGKWLSSTGLDELPQLINILKGEMSLVGPRPLPITEANKLPKEWAFRFLVKPGLFSFWALDKRRHQSLKIWKKLEIETVSKGNLTQDFVIICKIVKLQLGSIFSKNN